VSDDVRLALAYLSRVAEPPCPELARLVADIGPVEAAGLIRSGDVEERLTGLTAARREIDCAARDLEILDRLGGRLITDRDAEWPTLAFAAFGGVGVRSRPSGHPPMALWVLGPAVLGEVAERAAAVVGTRAASAYGEHVTADLAAGLAERDVSVVSGGAYGIDGAAHRATLATDGVTVAVLASGLDIPYPSGNVGLLRRIAECGVVISEYPPGVHPARRRFLTRNRLVAALSGASVVVEAGLRSGAANTAAWARALGRSVCAVPGPVTSSASAGCHALIRGGAELVTRAEEIVELIGHIGEFAPEQLRPESEFDDLSESEQRVYDALPARGTRTADQLAVASGLAPTEVLGPLAMLELAGLVVHADGRWKVSRRPSGVR
jgi:DNA processing protein